MPPSPDRRYAVSENIVTYSTSCGLSPYRRDDVDEKLSIKRGIDRPKLIKVAIFVCRYSVHKPNINTYNGNPTIIHAR
jgi:hypothetical protein